MPQITGDVNGVSPHGDAHTMTIDAGASAPVAELHDGNAPPAAGPDLGAAPPPTAINLPVAEAAKRKSNVPMIAGGVVLMVLAALVGASLFAGATARTEVLTVSRALEPGHVVVDSDLSITQIAGGAGIEVIAATERASLIGRTVTSPLPEGSIIHPGFFDADTAMVRTQTVHIGAELGAGEYPSQVLRGGTPVTLYLINEDGAPEELAAEIVSAEASGSGGDLLITFEVEEADAGLVASAAARSDLRFGTVQTQTVDALAESESRTETDTDDGETEDQPR